MLRPPSGEGTDELLGAVEEHRRHLEDSGEAGRRAEARLRDEAADLVGEWARAEARHLLDGDEALADRLREEGTPYGTAEEILSRRGGRLIPDAARGEP